MKLSQFDYKLPEDLIAKTPAKPRDHSRLLVLSKKNGAISHHTFYDIIDYLKRGDVLVLNNSKVIPARLFGRRADTGGKVEILLNKNIDDARWEVIGKNLKPNTKIIFNHSDLSATILAKTDEISIARFNMSGKKFFLEIEKIGHTPLPPYIKKNDAKEDKINYQTVYAKPIGSVAAPTAGLHLTKELLSKLKRKGVEIATVTLHVGLGTFAPVKEENIEDHQIHSEYYTVIPREIDKIIKAKQENRRVIAVGTTTTRVLETIFSGVISNAEKNPIFEKIRRSLVENRTSQGDNAVSGETSIFIYPGYKFHCIDGLITNFHLPKSTLLMLVSAFAGKKNIDRAYQEAIKNNYRFYSYGDAMLII